MAATSEWIADPARLGEVAAAWDRLARVDPSPFSTHAWLVAWWRAFGGDAEPRVLALWEGGELVAGLAVVAGRGRLGAMANEQSPAFRPLARDADGRERLSRELLSVRLPLVARALPEWEADNAALIAMVDRLGGRSVLEPDYVSPIADTTGALDDYRARLARGWRELERRGRKLRREHAVEEVVVAPPTELDSELAEGLALESSGWKGISGTAVLSRPDTAAFYRDMATAFHARGELRLSSLRVDGRLAAFDLALLDRGRYYLLKTAYDESLRSLAPGLVLRRAVVERCFGLGLDAHEFLGADMPWKRLFATGEREHFVWRAWPSGARNALGYAYRRRVRPLIRGVYLRGRAVARSG